jgi:t-SNARE complex subunit (syntaxin)
MASLFRNSNNNNIPGYSQINTDDYSDASSDEGDDFIQAAVRNQRATLSAQDEGLEMLAQSANRLGQMSLGIQEELDYQNNLLSDMEDDLDGATDRLDMVTKKTKEMIQKAGGMQNFILIAVLVAVVVVLVFLILYS